MPLFALGINHNTAPVDIRERMAFDPGHIPAALRGLLTLPMVREALILSTCNRTEVYGLSDHPDCSGIVEWLVSERSPEDPQVRERLYVWQGDDAVRHMLRVACGLDSMILGEQQILGQFKQAYETAVEAGSTGPVLHRLMQHGFSVAKQVRTDTRIGASAISVAYAAVSLARQIFADFGRHTALLVGAGETMELVARHLHEQGTGRMIIANRSLERAHALAQEFKAYAIELHDIRDHLAEADIVISSTASPDPVISRAMVTEALEGARHRPVFMVDIAVPRDIEPAVAELPDVYLYTIDDLRDVIEENLQSRRDAARQADEIIEVQISHFARMMRSLDAVPAIRALREQANTQRDQTLAAARAMLAAGKPVEEVLDYLAHTLTNRLIHNPTSGLRQAAEEGDESLLDIARRLFDLDPE